MKFFDTIEQMDKGKKLYVVIKKFAQTDLSVEHVSSMQMGYIMEEIIRAYSENASAGDHFTPREVIRCLTQLLLAEGCDDLYQDGKVFLPHQGFLGYKYDERRNIVVDEDTAWVVRLIYREFLSGRTFRQIGRMLEEKHVKTPGGKEKWRDTTVRSILRNEKYCGCAILQKTFVEDFLTHATKVNNGEVPKYYVKDSHPAIIPKEEWDMVQIELERRARLRYSYSSKNCFSSKIVCADCGHLYGPKVWHSTDKYRKVIWQCNYKFDRKGKKQCETPDLDEEAVKAMFVKAYNQIRENEGVLANLEKALTEVTSEESINADIARVKEDIGKTVEAVEALIRSSLDRETDDIKQKELEARYDAQVKRLKELEKQRDEANDKRNRIAAFISSLRDKGNAITEFDEELFNVMVRQAVVNRDRTIEFEFNSGYKVKVEAGE